MTKALSDQTEGRERGIFITFEGVDGCGKSTQMRRFAARLRESGTEVVETVEPGGTRIGCGVRALVLDPAHQELSSTAELLLYFAARAQNVDEVIEPGLSRGAVVLSDRWTDSTLAYQGGGRGLGFDVVDRLDEIACRGLRPDLTFLVHIDLETSLARAQERNRERAQTGAASESRLDDESREFFYRVQDAYAALTAREPERFCVIDGLGSIEEVEQRIWNAFQTLKANHV